MAETKTQPMSLTNMLSRFGINYPNAPAPTPAMAAFQRGIGMSMDTAEDAARVNELRMRERATQSREEITRQNDRSLTRMTGDLQSRGVLSSGETNTRVARQAEDVAKQQGDVEQNLAEGVDRSQQGLAATSNMYGQQLLERTLGVETDTDQRKAVAAAQEQSWTRQTEADAAAWTRQSEADERTYQRTRTDLAERDQKEIDLRRWYAAGGS